VGETRNAYSVLMENTERKRPFGRSGRRWDNIKKGFKDVERQGVEQIELVQDME